MRSVKAEKRLQSYRKFRKILETSRLGVCGGQGGCFIVNSKKRVAQKLHIVILLHYGLVTFRFHFRKYRKTIMFMIVWFLDVSMTPQTIFFKLWRLKILQNIQENTKLFLGNTIFGIFEIPEFDKCENCCKGGADKSWRFVLQIRENLAHGINIFQKSRIDQLSLNMGSIS